MWRRLLNFALVLVIVDAFQEFELLKKTKKALNFEEIVFRTSSASYSCNLQIGQLQKSAESRDLWANVMRDSWGGIPSGIYSGNAVDFGNYDQCINIDENTSSGRVVGKHCILSIPFERLGEARSEKMSTAFRT